MVPDWPKKYDFINIGTLYMKHDEAAVWLYGQSAKEAE